MAVEIAPCEGAILMGKDMSRQCPTTFWRELCKNGRTDRDAGYGQGGTKEACVTWGAHCRHLANTIEPSVSDDDGAFFVKLL